MAALQQPYSKNLINQLPYMPGRGGDAPTINNYISIAKLVGDNPSAVMNDDAYGAFIGNTPTRTYYWNILSDVPTGSESISIGLQIELIMYTMLYSPVSLSST